MVRPSRLPKWKARLKTVLQATVQTTKPQHDLAILAHHSAFDLVTRRDRGQGEWPLR